jgi:uncharacterized protein (TIGR03905 family)
MVSGIKFTDFKTGLKDCSLPAGNIKPEVYPTHYGGLVMQEIVYKPKGVCARQIRLAVDHGILTHVSFEDGCDGNSQGLSRLLEGMPVAEVIRRLKGISCEGKETSCPDQLARALEGIAEEQK